MSDHTKKRKAFLERQKHHNAPIEEIEATHLRLLRPTAVDALILRNLWRNERVRQFLGGVISEEVIEGKIASLQQHWDKHGFGQWTIYEKDSGQIIGLCGLHHSDEGIEISYMFFPAFWGRGRATEAASTSLNHGFRLLGFDRIVAITQEANHGSFPPSRSPNLKQLLLNPMIRPMQSLSTLDAPAVQRPSTY